MRRACMALAVTLLTATPTPALAAPYVRPPVVFIHGMGTSAADIGTTQFADLLRAIGRRSPARGVCQRDAQPDRPWPGSPCVFRYVEDASESDEGPNDSQSSVRENADKLAREIEETSEKSSGVILVGYSMGGAIIRTYLATHRADAEKHVKAVVLIDAVASGSWGYAFTGAVPRRIEGPLGAKLTEVMRSLAATTSAVDFDRPATTDLSPRSALFRELAPKRLPRNISYYTFWGDIRIAIERKLLAYSLPDFSLPPLGDLGLLPGDPDPSKLPELGGQRFSPPTDDRFRALDVPHTTEITLRSEVISQLISTCGQKAAARDACRKLVAKQFNVPNTHTQIPNTMGRVMVDVPELGGRVSVLDAVLAAIEAHA